MELGNYKIKVTTEAESKEAQELFFALGYKAGKIDRLGFVCTDNGLIYAESMEHWDSYEGKILTLHQLRDLVVLHRNDVKDANYIKNDGEMFGYLSSDNIEYTWNFVKNNWFKSSIYFSDSCLKPINRELISGADALRALADGKEVEFFYRDVWDSIGEMIVIGHFMSDKFKFRLKPQTITLSLEIPAPFEPKDGDTYWAFHPAFRCGYAESQYLDISKDKRKVRMQFGAWRTEAEIKQVVAALRGALKNG